MKQDTTNNIKKNEFYTMHIDDIGTNGEGIGKVDGFTLFVADALPGDYVYVKVVKVLKRYGFGKLIDIITPSPKRCEIKCKSFQKCGGCQLQHLKYQEQLNFKRNKVINSLERIGKLEGVGDKVEDTIGMENPYHYRNKVQLPIGLKDEKIIAGFYATKSHRIVEQVNCNIQHPINDKIVDILIRFMENYHIKPYNEYHHQGLVRHLVTRISKATGEISVTIVINGDKLKNQIHLIEQLKKIKGMTSISLSMNKDKTNVILGKKLEVIWGKPYITDSIQGISFQISPQSFYQVNPIQTEKLYAKALEFAGLTGEETVWDAYCGIGTISLLLAQKAKKVYGVEIVKEAIQNAEKNAELNGITNVDFFAGKAEEVIRDCYKNKGINVDTMVVDPPRKGCDVDLINTMIEMEPRKIVYVSCDPATLARDVKLLCEGGYEVDRVVPVDMFPMTTHVECVLSMIKV